MFEIEPSSLIKIPLLDSAEAEKTHRWKLWVAREIQLRALLAHYILDGQISQFSGDPTCTRHAANPLELPSSDSAFEASTVDEWIIQMGAANHHNTSFRTIFSLLFYTPNDLHDLSPRMSSFTIRVLLEGLKSLVLEDNDTEDGEASRPVVGRLPRHEICRALGCLYRYIQSSAHLSSADRSEALIRWHAISLDLDIESTRLCRTLCHHLNIEQKIFGGAKKGRNGFDARAWTNNIGARRALLHAVAIHELVESLPIGRSRAIHIPSSLFAAATVYCSFSLTGTSTLNLPYITKWEDVMAVDVAAGKNPIPNGLFTPSNLTGSDVEDFLYGLHPGKNSSRMSRNILYDLNLLQMFLRFASQQWGVCSEMENILGQWISLCT